MTDIIVNDATTLSVRGFAELEVAPDYAVISFGVVATADDADEALALASDDAEACRMVLAETSGVRSSTVSRVRVRESTHWDKKKDVYVSDGFHATLSGSAEVDVASVSALIATLVGPDPTFTGTSPPSTPGSTRSASNVTPRNDSGNAATRFTRPDRASDPATTRKHQQLCAGALATFGRARAPSRFGPLTPRAVPVQGAGYSGVWQTASTLLPSGSRTNAP